LGSFIVRKAMGPQLCLLGSRNLSVELLQDVIINLEVPQLQFEPTQDGQDTCPFMVDGRNSDVKLKNRFTATSDEHAEC
jgi:hypothetical protein